MIIASCVHTEPTLSKCRIQVDIHCLGQLESVCSLLRCVVWAINKHLVSDNLLPCQRAPPWHSAGDWTLTQTAPRSEYQCCVLRVFIAQLSTRELICHTREYYIHTREYKFPTREFLFIFPCSTYSRVQHGNMSTEWYTREYELHTREYELSVTHGNIG